MILVLVFTTAGLTALGYALLWRTKVMLQLRLDRCVESKALTATRIQNAIEASNRRMQIERAAAVAAAIPTGGGSLRAVKIALVAERIIQESLRIRWRTEQARWLVQRGCDGKNDRFFPLPALRWRRPPDDPLGPLPLQWQKLKIPGGKEDALAIRIWKSNRFSQAEFYRGSTMADPIENSEAREKWQARWIPRVGNPRTSLD